MVNSNRIPKKVKKFRAYGYPPKTDTTTPRVWIAWREDGSSELPKDDTILNIINSSGDREQILAVDIKIDN